MFNRQKIAATVLAAVALGFVGVATAGTASASKVDDRFIQALEAEGIEFKSDEGAVELGHAVCNDLDKGATPDELFEVLLEDGNLTDRQAAAIVVESISAYCPEHEDLLDA